MTRGRANAVFFANAITDHESSEGGKTGRQIRLQVDVCPAMRVGMRVIAGQYRSRALKAPPGTATRPTSDRMRETLFNVLAPHIAGARFADLYAGSGAVGIEALSRGASQVYFSEASRVAAEIIRENLRSLKIDHGILLESGGTPTLLKRLHAAGAVLDLVFLDPPYEAADEYTRTLAELGGVSAALLRQGALVVAEHSRKHALSESYGRLQRTRVLLQGDAALSFYAMRPEGADSEEA